MKSRIFFVIFIFLALNDGVFAFGKKDEAAVQTQNNEWVLCITNFNTKSLPNEKAVIVPVIIRKMTERLNSISYRTRVSWEYAYYEGAAWSQARSTAAKAIATKMDERSAELFRGNPRWRYNQNIKKIDNDLIKLRANLEEIENKAPLINSEPVFKLTSGNVSSNYPEAPAAGAESGFCITQSADAFLTGSIIDFHGRFLLSMKLYVLYTKSFVWEDRIIFSQDDIDTALDDILQKLLVVLAGNEPAIISIAAEPENTLILINRSFAGKGNTGSLEYPPSTVTVTASAPEHESITFETSLSANEITKIDINLVPLNYTDVIITGEEGNKIYHGALYVGASPLTLRLPVNNLEFVEMRSHNSPNKGTIVLQTHEETGVPPSFYVKTKPPLRNKRVDLDRRIFYWAWAGTWITGITAWIANHSYDEITKAYVNGISPYDFSGDRNTLNSIRSGAIIAVGTAAVYSVYRFFRYLYTANRDSTSLTAPVQNKKTEPKITPIETETSDNEEVDD